MNRRDFLKVVVSGALSVSIAGSIKKSAFASWAPVQRKEFFAILVDTTRCIGCRSCERACSESHGLYVPDLEDRAVFKSIRKTDERRLTVVNRFETERGEIYVKTQCMHCNQPACVAACLVRAMKKREEGPVTWNENCMGCRYCMVSCPFDIPKFEYDKPFGRIMKCDMCYERLKKERVPACVEACPTEALTFGLRKDILHEAKKRIYSNPGNYYPYIYGETEVGGTGYLYLSAVPFDKLGFSVNLGSRPYPELTVPFLYTVPLILILWPAFLTGVHYLTKKAEKGE